MADVTSINLHDAALQEEEYLSSLEPRPEEDVSINLKNFRHVKIFKDCSRPQAFRTRKKRREWV